MDALVRIDLLSEHPLFDANVSYAPGLDTDYLPTPFAMRVQPGFTLDAISLSVSRRRYRAAVWGDGGEAGGNVRDAIEQTHYPETAKPVELVSDGEISRWQVQIVG